ncbi:MAG: AAA family ATPase [Acidobacteria bacterium]|nr:AAA family ATPase [Acidobacteriota bacterium]
MQVTHLRLENWRNFTHVDVQLQQRVFVAGPNAAGKSNLLDVFRFLNEVTTRGGGLEKAVSDRGGVSKIRCLAARRQPAIVVDVGIGRSSEDNGWRYRLSFVQNYQRQPTVDQELVEHHGRTVLRRPDDDDKKDPERLRQTHLEGVSTNKRFREIYRFFNSIEYVNVLPQLLRQPERFVNNDLSAEKYGSDLLERIARTQTKTQQSRLRRIEETLRIAVPQLRELTLTTDEYGFPHLEGLYEHWRPNADRQREDQFSDGTLRLTGLLWAVMDGSGPLLMAEPELNLHPAVVRALPQLLHRATRKTKRQVMISTHSPDLLSDEGIGVDEVVLLRPHRNGTYVELAGADDTTRVLVGEGASLADAVLPRTAPRDIGQLRFASWNG